MRFKNAGETSPVAGALNEEGCRPDDTGIKKSGKVTEAPFPKHTDLI